MPVDMKEMMAEAVRKLLMDKKVKKLTVKDIVEECQITRQSFYYHFEDIPALLQWILEQGTERMLQEARKMDGEEALRYLFLVTIQVRPYVQKTMQTNYGDEVERLMKQHFYQMLLRIAEEQNLYPDLNRTELKWVLRYHCYAILGLWRDWTEEDTRNLDQIVHEVYRLLTGGILPYSKMPEALK
jgi:transcriptional regulator, tetR family